MTAENPVVEAEVVEVKKEEVVASKFIGGEIRIVADGNTGAISVEHPENMIAAMGLLEMAKVIMVDNLKNSMNAAPKRPAIIPAGAEALKHLKPQSH